MFKQLLLTILAGAFLTSAALAGDVSSELQQIQAQISYQNFLLQQAQIQAQQQFEEMQRAQRKATFDAWYRRELQKLNFPVLP
jgi:hypothetical protein